MWAIDNQTPFAAERTFVRDRDGAEIWLVAVRATFDLFPDGTLQISEKQEPVALAPAYFGMPGASSLRCDSDLQRVKLGTDVLLNASAYVPANHGEVTEIEVGFRLGDIEKRLMVSGEREWEKRLGVFVPSSVKPFRKSEIRYENSFGGTSTDATSRSQYIYAERNPVGTGLKQVEGKLLPSISNKGESPDRPKAKLPVAGFGAICGHWSPRRELSGTYDDQWQKEKRPLLPNDFQDAWFQSAPKDQISSEFLHGGDQVELMNLTPSGKLRFQLPKYSFGFRTSIGGGIEHHRANLHTVLIEPDDQKLTMVWHTALPCHHTLYTLRRTVVFEKKRLDDREVAA